MNVPQPAAENRTGPMGRGRRTARHAPTRQQKGEGCQQTDAARQKRRAAPGKSISANGRTTVPMLPAACRNKTGYGGAAIGKESAVIRCETAKMVVSCPRKDESRKRCGEPLCTAGRFRRQDKVPRARRNDSRKRTGSYKMRSRGSDCFVPARASPANVAGNRSARQEGSGGKTKCHEHGGTTAGKEPAVIRCEAAEAIVLSPQGRVPQTLRGTALHGRKVRATRRSATEHGGTAIEPCGRQENSAAGDKRPVPAATVRCS